MKSYFYINVNKNIITYKLTYYIVFNILILKLFAQSNTVTFNYTGSVQTWTVPPCVYSINVTAKGAKGGGNNGGLGATVSGNIAVTPGQVLQIYVGGTGTCPGTGYNGGGNGASANSSSNAGCGGGGATDLRVSPYGLSNRVIVAAGGGGMGGGDTDAQGGVGGCSSGTSGGSPYGVGGGGGTQTSGGAGGPPWISSGNWGQAGSLGNGGNGATDPCYNLGPGGGGGGGYYGGGGGGSDCYSSYPLGGGGGGGGSSLIPSGGTCTQGNNSGNGYLTITYSPSAVAGTVSASNTTICEGQIVTLTVTGSIGNIQWQISTNGGTTWSNINGATNTSLNSGQLYNNTCYRVSADCGGTSVYSNSVCINVNPIPIATATPSTQTFCSGGTTNITLNSIIANTTYNWTVAQTGVSGASNGSGNSIIQTLTNTGTNPGTATYTITPTANGCTGSPISVNITVNPNPTITVTANPSTICNGQSTVLNATGAANYSWSNGLGSGNSYTITPLTSTTYTVTGTNSYGCTSTNSVSVTVNPIPTVSISPTTPTICQNQSINLQASGATTYVWNTNDTTSSIIVSPTSTTTYTVTGSNTYGCSNSVSVTVTVYPNPTVSITPNNPSICLNNSITLSASGGISYLWNTGNSSQNITVTPLVSTTYTVTVTDINTCSASNNVVVTVYSTPPANAGADQNICEGTSTQLNASGGITYAWSPSTGLSNSSISNPIANPSITTTYTVTITDVNGCYATDDVVITVLPIPIINILPSSGKICVGDTITINANGAITYNWTPSIGLSSDTSATTIAQPSVTTTYTVTGANQYGCTNYNSITISVEPLPILTISPNVAGVCSGQSINISVNGAANYIWAPSTGLSSTTGSSVIASPITTTTYNITGISASGCTSDTNYTVTVLPSPLVNFSASISEGCSPLTVNFLNSSTGNIQSWLWNFNDPNSGPLNTSNLANPSHTFNLPGSYDISLTVTNTDGCSDTYTYVGMINVYPQPIANFIMNPNIGSMNQPTISFVDQSVNANSWLWNFGESSSGTNNFSNLQNPQHTYSAPGTYTVWLVVSSNFDCTDSISKTINIQDSYTFWAPNAFTPNGDGINEYFIPKGTGIDPDNFKMYIFDRWGKQIYYTDSYNNPWDGSINSTGKLAPQGVYTWVIKTTDRNGMEMRYIGKILLLP